MRLRGKSMIKRIEAVQERSTPRLHGTWDGWIGAWLKTRPPE